MVVTLSHGCSRRREAFLFFSLCVPWCIDASSTALTSKAEGGTTYRLPARLPPSIFNHLTSLVGLDLLPFTTSPTQTTPFLARAERISPRPLSVPRLHLVVRRVNSPKPLGREQSDSTPESRLASRSTRKKGKKKAERIPPRLSQDYPSGEMMHLETRSSGLTVASTCPLM